MNILATQISLKYRAFEIYLAGCNAPHCPGCHNPEGWDFNSGEDVNSPKFLEKLNRQLRETRFLIKNIWIMGGEPLDQPLAELEPFLKKLSLFKHPVTLFTRYDLEAVPMPLRKYLKYVKTGRYKQELADADYQCMGIRLASTNQQIHAV